MTACLRLARGRCSADLRSDHKGALDAFSIERERLIQINENCAVRHKCGRKKKRVALERPSRK